jgi:hypothetical protein
MPRKEFEAFTRLDASDVNDFLMDQTIMVFGGTAARGSAIATPTEGMYTHLNDTDSLEYWSGSAWEGVGGAGVLQVVQGTIDVVVSSSSTTFADTGLSATITPSSTSSNVLVFVNQSIQKSAANASNAVNIKIFRDATEILLRTRFLENNTAAAAYGAASLQILDSPNTTSAITYKTQFANNNASAAVNVQVGTQDSFITLMEVAG